MFGHSIVLALCAIGALGLSPASAAPKPAAGRGFDLAQAIVRAQERLARERELWPGYDPLAIPLAIYTGEATYLFRHPAPPEGFSPVSGVEPPAYAFAGRHPAVTSNSSADVGGTATGTLLADGERAKKPAEELAAVAIHEAFHVYQRGKHPTWQGNEGDLFLYPFADARQLGLRRLEEQALQRALVEKDSTAASCWTRRALAHRHDRFAAMDSAFATYERGTELNEALATYVQLRARDEKTVEFPGVGFGATEVRRRAYAVGPALALLLDRFLPRWQEMLETDDHQTLDALLAGATSRDAGGSDRCALPSSQLAAIEAQAVKDAAAVVKARTARRKSFDARSGWRLIVEASEGQPLWPQGFDPLNVEQVDGGILHTRFVRLGNGAGQMSAIDEAGADLEALSEGAGAHPLFNGVRRVEVAGLAKPVVQREGERTTIRAPGLSAEFQHATIQEQQGAVVVTLR